MHRIHDSINLLEIAREEPIAVPRPVLVSSAPALRPDEAAEPDPGEENRVEVATRGDLGKESTRRGVDRLDLHAHRTKMRSRELDDALAHGNACRRHEAQAEPLAGARVNSIRALATSRLGEQAPCPGDVVAVAAPVRAVGGLAREEACAVERPPRGSRGLGLDLPGDGDAVDAERERTTHERRSERWMTARAHPESKVLRRRRRPRRHAPARKPSNLTCDLRAHEVAAEGQRDIDLVPPEWVEGIERVLAEAMDEAVEVRRVWPPVAGVPDEREALAALEGLDEEGAARDRPARPRAVDPVTPDLGYIQSRERVPR